MDSVPKRPDEQDEVWHEIEAALSVAYAALTDALALYDGLYPRGSTSPYRQLKQAACKCPPHGSRSPASTDPAIGWVTLLVKQPAHTVARAGSARPGQANVHRSPLGRVAPRHAAPTMLQTRWCAFEESLAGSIRRVCRQSPVYPSTVAFRFPVSTPIRDRPSDSPPWLKPGAPSDGIRWVRHGDLRERLVGMIASIDLVADPLPESFNGQGDDEARQ